MVTESKPGAARLRFLRAAAAHGELHEELSRLGEPLLGQLPPGGARADDAERTVIAPPKEHVCARDVERRGYDNDRVPRALPRQSRDRLLRYATPRNERVDAPS